MITMQREPCKGKEQCDPESARAKNVMKSYVDAGNKKQLLILSLH